MSKLDDILEPLTNSLRSWVEDQLSGTSYYTEAIEGLNRDAIIQKQQIKALILELIGKDEPWDNPSGSVFESGNSTVVDRNEFREELREKVEQL